MDQKFSTNFWAGFEKRSAEDSKDSKNKVTVEVKAKGSDKKPAEKKPKEGEQPEATPGPPIVEEEQAPKLEDAPFETGVGFTATDPDASPQMDRRWERLYDRRPDLLSQQAPEIILKYQQIVKKYPEVFLKEGTIGAHGAELVGLSMLATPHLTPKKMRRQNEKALELAGLGTLAMPSAYELAKRVIRKGK